MSRVEDLMVVQIKEKNNQIFAGKWNSGRFSEAKTMHGTDIGDVGEKFIKDLFVEFGYVAMQSGHDEYDILVVSALKRNIKIEIKTAKEGRNNDSYQFDGVDPRHNAEFTILLGISNDSLYFNYFRHEDKAWNHNSRSWYVNHLHRVEGPKKLVRMSPNNEFSLKLTLSRSQLIPMSDENIKDFLVSVAEEEAVPPLE